MAELPDIADGADFEGWRSRPNQWLPLVHHIAREEGINPTVLSQFGNSTNLVVDLDDKLILKLFPPIYRTQFVSERNALRYLAGKMDVPIPSIKAEGEGNGWNWLIITKLDGTAGSMVWPLLPEEEKERLLEQIGGAISSMQALPPADLGTCRPSWRDFMKGQIDNCFEHHRQLGMSPGFLSDLRMLLADATSVIPLDAPPVILTGDWIPQNILLSEDRGVWKLAGIIDFGDVMTGWGEYDLLAPTAFMCAGLHGRTQSLLRGYGVVDGECDGAMRRRLLTLTLLHAESDLRKVDIDGWEDRATSLFDLGDIIWPSAN
ncbi:aminoglycoside 3'-phosphotransferase/choline kinase family protein [Mesorhizobium ciceri]|uniref:aminoglycoside phosphotransferase family protein n=1 Tax=Mesorhizobium ciceri TaxID=39645 RepID=UPI0007A94A1F|nr:aminoglycoside 3'-phosphotransferase/choline kinase family protein [Mesorhizobium ciceri]AMY00092.1 hypothetical protein A4R29_11730 [Mesorhizobium ciceri biovar biserrulae]